MQTKALIMNVVDNVATAICPLHEGEAVSPDTAGERIEIVIKNAIPFGHKFALKDIDRGETIVKYGETIGKSVSAIGKGEHVHVHNVEGLRGRGDKQ
jgi:altronate dehydratase small subunit